jgi:hypothetical protein
MTFNGIHRLLLLVLMALALAGCQTEDTPAKPKFVSTTSDSRNSNYFVEFRSRYALSYGHTYVVFGRTDGSGRMINPEVAGLHPKSTSAVPYVIGHFVPVPAETGASDGDLEEPYRSASWRVMLSQAEYNKVVKKIRELQANSKLWQAALYNCNAFTGDVARSMGFSVPPIQLRPQEFVTKLREMNEGRRSVSPSRVLTAS